MLFHRLTGWKQLALALLTGLVCIVAALPTWAASQDAPARQLRGMLTIAWGDAQRGAVGGGMQHVLHLDDGSRVLLQPPAGDDLQRYANRRIVISGRDLDGASGFAGRPSRAAQVLSVRAETAEGVQALQTPSATGQKKVLFILLKFQEDSAVPHAASFYTDLTNPDVPPPGALFPATLNGFFKKTSNGLLSWQANTAGKGGLGAPQGWLTLPFPRSHYITCGSNSLCADLSALGNDGTALARAEGVTLTDYDTLNFVFSNDLDCCAWGGGYWDNVDHKGYAATWEPPWGQETTTWAHELGHSLGLPHSGWVYYAYDSPWDIMSSRASEKSMICGSYRPVGLNFDLSISCGEPGNGYIAPYKNHLGWIPDSQVVTTDTFQKLTVFLEGSGLPMGTNARMIKICLPGRACDGPQAVYYSVEARIANGGADTKFDNAIPANGVVIHQVDMQRAPISGPCYFNNQSGWAMPIDVTPGDYDSAGCKPIGPWNDSALWNAELKSGQTYRDKANGFALTATEAPGLGFTVKLVNTRDDQTISAIVFSDTRLKVGGTVRVNATASSGLRVAFSSVTPTVCTVVDRTVTGIAAGRCVVEANQAGNQKFNPAPAVQGRIAVR